MAPRFSFRLERLLGLRLAEEQQCARLLANARSAADEARTTLEQSERRLTDAVAQTSSATLEVQTAGMLQALLFGLELARGQVERDREILEQLERELAERATAYDESRAARRALEMLREQRRATWTVEQDQAEQRASDEAARFVTTKTGESA
jgi:flagellar export protein FliJ